MTAAWGWRRSAPKIPSIRASPCSSKALLMLCMSMSINSKRARSCWRKRSSLFVLAVAWSFSFPAPVMGNGSPAGRIPNLVANWASIQLLEAPVSIKKTAGWPLSSKSPKRCWLPLKRNGISILLGEVNMGLKILNWRGSPIFAA